MKSFQAKACEEYLVYVTCKSYPKREKHCITISGKVFPHRRKKLHWLHTFASCNKAVRCIFARLTTPAPQHPNPTPSLVCRRLQRTLFVGTM